MARDGSKTARRKRVNARVKVWLEKDGEYVFGYGISQILKAVRRAGSIKAGAALLGKSYRYVWGRIKEAEEALGEPLVETRVGGTGLRRASLTDAARRLVTDYDALRKRMFQVAQDEFSSRFDFRGTKKRQGQRA